MLPVFYDRAQITDWLGAHTVAKAQRYRHAVSQVAWADNTLSGKVQGTQRQPYRVHAHFEQDDDDLLIEGECSCPVGIDCKHVAALLIAGLELIQQPPSGVRSQVVEWFPAPGTRASP